jgi:hypothetical protein
MLAWGKTGTCINSSSTWRKPQLVWGCPSVSPHVRQKAMIDHKCSVGRPEKDEMTAAGGIHVHFDRTSNRGRLEEPVDLKGVYPPKGVTTKSDESLVRRFGGTYLCALLTRAGSRATAFSGRSLPRRYRSRLPARRTACKAQEDNRSP